MDKPQTVEVYWQVVGQPELPVHQVKGDTRLPEVECQTGNRIVKGDIPHEQQKNWSRSLEMANKLESLKGV